VSVARIVSGGQTGADRGGLDAAIELGLPHGGFCPKGRLAEDGVVPARYALEETESAEYEVRTRKNVEASDATVVFTHGALTGGSALTARHAKSVGRPLLWVDLVATTTERAVTELRDFVERTGARTLNVAGARESHAPGIAEQVRRVVRAALR
jgi:hypothetical protein